MPRRNDFAEGFLQGLYNAGIGNPAVNDARKKSQMELAFKQAELNAKADENGNIPVTPGSPVAPAAAPPVTATAAPTPPPAVTSATPSLGSAFSGSSAPSPTPATPPPPSSAAPAHHPVMNDKGFLSTLRDIIYPSTTGDMTLNTAFKRDPTRPTPNIAADGKVVLSPPGTPVPAGAMKLDDKQGATLLNMQRSKDPFIGLNADSASPEEADLAMRMVNGEIRPSDLSYKNRGNIVMLASQLAKKNGLPFQSYSGDVKAGMAKDSSTGVIGQNALSLNTALGHVSSLSDAFDAVKNTDINLINQPLNKLRTMTSDPNVVRLGITLNAVRGELSNVFKKSGGTDQEIASWTQYLNDSLTPSQVAGALPQIDDLLRSRLSALEYQRNNVMNNAPSNRTLLSPKGAATMKKLDAKNQPSSGTDSSAKSKTVTQNGHVYTLNPATGKYE